MMTNRKILMAVLLSASLVAPAAYAKAKAPAPAEPVSTSGPSSNASSNSQAGGLPATNARVATLEAAVVDLRAALAAEVAARRAADAALADRIAAIPQVFAGEGAADNIHGATVTVATKTVPAGSYFVLAAVRMVNGQSTGNANARCVLSADGNLLADTSDLQFPILNTTGGALGSTMFAPLQGSYSSSAPITIHVECTEDAGTNGGLNAFAQIMALQAAAVH